MLSGWFPRGPGWEERAEKRHVAVAAVAENRSPRRVSATRVVAVFCDLNSSAPARLCPIARPSLLAAWLVHA